MNEWYVIMAGKHSSWNPVVIVVGRLEALVKLTDGIRVTSDENRALGRFLEGPTCNLGEGVMIVGSEDSDSLDRRLVRVIGPDTTGG